MPPITVEHIRILAPHCCPEILAALPTLNEDFALFGLNAKALRLAHFFAQVLEETGGFTAISENLNYSEETLLKLFPTHFRLGQQPTAAAIAHKPEQVANAIYGGRLGNTAPGDGWLYRGRGALQLTGKANYQAMHAKLSTHFQDVPDFAAHPDLVNDPKWILKIPAAFWDLGHLNDKADQDDIVGITKVVNGGLINLDTRRRWLAKTKAVWHS